MEVIALTLPGLLLVKPRVHRDLRGALVETFHADRYREAGITDVWAQDNQSTSAHLVVRGLHRQPGQAKLVRCARGRIWDVAFDPATGRYHGEFLDDESHHQLYIPEAYAHGFVVLSERADVAYKLSMPYDATIEQHVHYGRVTWPIDISTAILSERDR